MVVAESHSFRKVNATGGRPGRGKILPYARHCCASFVRFKLAGRVWSCPIVTRLERYSGLNLTNITNRERLTVEWRHHQGTIDWEKIKSWILFTQRMVEHAVRRSCHYDPQPVQNTRAGLNALLTTIGLRPNNRIYPQVDKELRTVGRYLLRRWRHFNVSPGDTGDQHTQM